MLYSKMSCDDPWELSGDRFLPHGARVADIVPLTYVPRRCIPVSTLKDAPRFIMAFSQASDADKAAAVAAWEEFVADEKSRMESSCTQCQDFLRTIKDNGQHKSLIKREQKANSSTRAQASRELKEHMATHIDDVPWDLPRAKVVAQSAFNFKVQDVDEKVANRLQTNIRKPSDSGASDFEVGSLIAVLADSSTDDFWVGKLTKVSGTTLTVHWLSGKTRIGPYELAYRRNPIDVVVKWMDDLANPTVLACNFLLNKKKCLKACTIGLIESSMSHIQPSVSQDQ